MNETVKFWIENLYKDEIKRAKGTISNEHLWELGYSGEEPNPHSGNIAILHEYIDVLESKLKEDEIKPQYSISIIDNDVYINSKRHECALMDKSNHEDDLNKRIIMALVDEMDYEAPFLFEEMIDRLNELRDEVDV